MELLLEIESVYSISVVSCHILFVFVLFGGKKSFAQICCQFIDEGMKV